MKKGKKKGERQAKVRRALKSWTKGPADRFADEDVAPNHPAPMRPRLKNIQHRENLDRSESLKGRVVASSGRGWIVEEIVQPDSDRPPMRKECVHTRSIISHNPDSTLIAVGDVVGYRVGGIGIHAHSGDETGGIIVEVFERSAKLGRRAAGSDGIEQIITSNVEQLVILMAAAEPFYNRRLIDRYLISAEIGELKPMICINKIDLMDEDEIFDDLRVYHEQLQIPTLFTSAVTGQGMELLTAALAGKISVISGPSGSGKSTLVNILLGGEQQATGEVSKKTFKGMHTTTFSEMFALPQGGFIVDTPGIREFGLWDLEPSEVQFYFHDFDELRYGCHFTSCEHLHEPNCAVKAAVEAGMIDPQRYESYALIIESLKV